MVLEGVLDGEALWARGTLVRLLPRVQHRVTSQVLSAGESFAACSAQMRLKFQVQVFHVQLQLRLAAEYLVTLGATKPVSTSVEEEVCLETSTLNELLATVGALVRPNTSMHAHVTVQGSLQREPERAKGSRHDAFQNLLG